MDEAAAFPHLLSPIRVGHVEIRNRIFSSGHDTVLVHDGHVTDDLVAYHQARAAGGVGLIVVQVAGIHESARYTAHVLMAVDDSAIEGYRQIVDAVHPHGTRVFGQLFHPGREVMESQDGSAPVAFAPSAVPNERFHVMPRALTEDLIEEIIQGYADGAARLKAAGMDGCEIVASHGYLPAQFLNPGINHRSDDWGGSAENRRRFLVDVLRRVRERVQGDFVVGVRISGDDESVDGPDAAEVLQALAAINSDGLVDYVSVVAGSSSTAAGSLHIAPPMSQPAAYTAPLAERIRATVSVPVMVAGRINQPQEAEQIIASGQADLTAMTRALIADPQLPVKAASGRAEQIRACVACNQACIGHFHMGYPISCIQHPETGRELIFGTRIPVRAAKDVMIVGGGPAGLKAAAVAAERGHRVQLFDAGRRLGGQVLLAELLPGRAEFGGVVTNLSAEAERAGAKLQAGITVDCDTIAQLAPDVLIVATGARPFRPPLEAGGELPIFEAWDVIRGASLPVGRIVIADWKGDWIGLGLAQMIAQTGRRTTLAVNGMGPGEGLQQYVRTSMVAPLIRAKVEILPHVRLYGYDDDSVYFQDTLTNDAEVVEDVAALVVSYGHTSVDDLLNCPNAGQVVAIGDALAPRSVEEAVLDGLRATHDL